jgi:hypothetical protein
MLKRFLNFFRWSIRRERGSVAILLTFFILIIILLVALATGNIMALEIKMSRDIGNSIPAFFAADAGIERCLYEVRKNSADVCGSSLNFTLTNAATYVVNKNSGQNLIESVGTFIQTKRKIEASW